MNSRVIARLNNNSKLIYRNNPDCQIKDKISCFNTKTALKSIQITIDRVNFCFQILISNLKYHHPDMVEFLDTIPILDVSNS